MIKNLNDIKAFRNFFAHHSGPITLEEIRRYFKDINPDISDNTVNWRTYELVNTEVLQRTGRGLFNLGEEITYQPKVSKLVSEISQSIKKRFPLIDYCVWDSGLLNEFAHHLSGYPFILIDVEKDVAESVYFQLKEDFKPVFYRLSPALINNLLPDFDYPLLIRNLVSETPLNRQGDIAAITLEKLLVDIFCDHEFSFLEGTELRNVYRNAFAKYTINKSKLIRYAARKGKKEEITNLVNQYQS